MRRLNLLILILLCSMLFGACGRDKDQTEGKTVDVYYINSKTLGLVTESYTLIGTTMEDQIQELIYMLQQKPPMNALYKNAVLQDINVNWSFDNSGSLLVDLSAAYNSLSKVDRVLCRAAIVKTLSQISGVEIFQFIVGGQPPADEEAGALTADDFVDSTDTNNVYKAKLYFADKEGDALIEYKADIDLSGDESIEELVIQQLINGPTELGMYSTIPEGTVLLNTSKADGICTVDFNEKFLEKLPNISADVAIYSVVNTLAELPDIHKVQFTINSEVQKTYGETKDFDKTFERNLELVEEQE